MRGDSGSVERWHGGVGLRGRRQQDLHDRARQLARRQFGNRVFVRGVVEVSNHCREDCAYCGMRRSHRGLNRFRADPDALADLLLEHWPEFVTDLNIQSGEDPVALREVVLPLIRRLRRETALGISVCLGTLDAPAYRALREAGASLYIMKFETAGPDRYQRFRAPGTFEERLDHIRALAASGWRVSSGFIAGLPGETGADLNAAIDLAAQLPLDGCSVSPFIPGNESALSGAPAGDLEDTLNVMALLRLRRPEWVIPAVSALNILSPRDGYLRGLGTGANLVTVNLTPGASRADYLLYRRDRVIMTSERIRAALTSAGLEPSPISLAAHYAGTPREVSRAAAGTAATEPVTVG
ncbi:MAG: radical SAM protein [Verrucomicrobiae bacterium]|nr:radical SAM protein [Verrucomicrobiae bacterium]